MPPKSRMVYYTANIAMKIVRDETPSGLCNKLMVNAYQEHRKEKFIYIYDNSHNKHGTLYYESSNSLGSTWTIKPQMTP